MGINPIRSTPETAARPAFTRGPATAIQEGERWRITAVQDEKLAKMISDAVVRSMPANGSEVQDSIRKQIEGLKW